MRPAVLALGLAWIAVVAPAHVVLHRATLRQWLQHSALSLEVEFASGPLVWSAPDGADRQEYFRVRILEVLRGDAPTADVLEFFPHAEGFPAFREGDRSLLFLEETRTRPEFRPLVARFPWFSMQGAGDEWVLRREPGDAVREQARFYAQWLAAGADPATAAAEFRRGLLAGFRSGVPALAGDSLLELVRIAAIPGVLDDAADTAPFAALIDDPALGLSTRLALLRALTGRPGVDVGAHWRRLLAADLERGEVRQLARAATTVDDPQLSNWLGALLRSTDPELRVVAAQALADPRHASHVPALARAAEAGNARVARAAIQALGVIGGDEARRALGGLAVGPDPERARWAGAALQRLNARTVAR
ncbi:MAG: HEAT repeat domain-containing protein [Proteobacteria bacterium]|nr:HEAT repeat domain-containing protein [Pseudomonadota bacterium]